jgi:hypothetical protein
MTKESTYTFEVHAPSPPIIIPARKPTSHITASVAPSELSPITGNPIYGNKLTLPSQTTSKNSSPDLASLSSSPLPLKTNNIKNTSLVSSPRYSSSYSSPSSSTTHLMKNGFHSTTRLPDTISTSKEEPEQIENVPEKLKRNTMKRSLSYSKEPNSLYFTPTFVRNPFNDCEIFSIELDESSSIRTNSSNSLNESNKSGSLKEKKEEQHDDTKLNDWDIIEFQLLALDNFRNWMLCFCVINFDLELGQAMDLMYPPSELTDDEKKNICFSAFPDSNSFDVGDTVFNFRIRCSQSGLVSSG